MEHAICDDWNPYFSIEDYYELVSPLKTVADIKKYYAIETGKIEEVRERFIKSRVVFPDEYDV